MTHPAAVVQRALELRRRGYLSREIANELGIPAGTVRHWGAGYVPAPSPRGGAGCQRCGRGHAFTHLAPEYVYLLGLYLGDGCIATHPRAYKLRIILDSAYPSIVEEAASAIRAVAERSTVNTALRPGCTEVYAYSKAWPCLFPQHGPGKKHRRRIELSEWQRRLVREHPRLLLRGLIHSDGCRFINSGRGWGHPRYSFRNLSPDIRRIFTDACDLVGLRWTTAPNTVYVSRKADVALLDRFIGPKR